MKKPIIVLIAVAGLFYASYSMANRTGSVFVKRALSAIENPLTDFDGYVKEVLSVAKKRVNKVITLDKFLQMAKEPNTIILDARSGDKYDMKHLKGAKHLSYTDFTRDSLAKVIPSKNTKVLLYCNNNFVNNSEAFATKYEPAYLNAATSVSLSSYEYKNVYELGPALDENNPKLNFEATGQNK